MVASVQLALWSGVLVCLAGMAGGFANTIASSGSAVTLPVLIGLGASAPVANGTNRVSVLVGVLAAMASFHRQGAIDWRRMPALGAAAGVGTGAGAALAVTISPADIHLAIVGAIFVALGLLCLRPKRWLRAQAEGEPRLGLGRLALIAAIGGWAGFIVLDAATYFLFALVLAVGYGLVRANAMKVTLLAVSCAVSLPVLIERHDVLWGPAAVLSVGAIGGSLVAARVALHPQASTWIFRILVVLIGGEAVQLGLQFV
jgi:uncharacterized membrane protein YfcA